MHNYLHLATSLPGLDTGLPQMVKYSVENGKILGVMTVEGQEMAMLIKSFRYTPGTLVL